MTFYLLIAAVDFIVGLLALTKRGNRATLALALICISAGVWSIELFLLTYLQDLVRLDFWFHLTRLGVFMIPPTLALLVSQLIRTQSKLFRYAVIYPGFAISLTLFVLNNTLFPSTLRPAIGGYLPVLDWIYYSFVFNFALCFIGAILFASLAFKSANSRDKQRIKWLLITVTVTFIPASFSVYLIAYDFYLAKFVSSMTNIVFMLLLFYATVQHHLLDIRLAVTMAISRIVLFSSLAGTYMLLTLSMPSLPNDASALVVFSILVLLALELYPTILKWLEPNAKRLLMAGNYDYSNVAAETSGQLKRCTSYGELSKLLDYLFNQVIEVKGYRVFLVEPGVDPQHIKATSIDGSKTSFDMRYNDSMIDPHLYHSPVVMVDEIDPELSRQLTAHSAVCFLPIRREGQLQAMVLVGASVNHSYYRYHDVRLMEWLVGELSQALHRIFIHEKLDNELAEAKKKLSMLKVMNLYHHDIKAPLSIIDGVVSNDLYDVDKRRSIILEQVAWGSRLIATMAQVLKADRKRKVASIDLQEVLDDCCFLFKRTVRHLSVEYSGSYTVQADADDLKILFINVIKNAVEAHQSGRVLTLHVKTWATSQSIYVAVADNGVGMTPQQLESLWLDLDSTKEGGNGIGLQAIKKIADEHEAKINVTSAVDRGTTFTFEFPRYEKSALDALMVPQKSLA